MTAGARIYFKGLNGIRAIAAMLVVVIHTGQYLSLFGLKPTEYYQWHWQSYAVTLFFVLSGFLITYLLIEEKSRTATVSLKGFYVRRILRIWPLYYLMVILTVLIYYFVPVLDLPKIANTPLALYAALLANVAFLFGALSPLSPLWSIGVEEQFYAIWPLMIKKSTSVFRMLVLVIILYLTVKALFIILGGKTINDLIANTRIDCMAIGGLGAVILREKKRLLSFLYTKTAQIICWGIFFYSTFYKPIHVMSSINHELYSILFMIIILNVSTNCSTIVNLENPFFDFLGKISYGLYVYHMLVIFLLRAMLKPFLSQSWHSYVIVYAAVVAATIVIAQLSYRFFELPFLKMKDRFSVVLSQGWKVTQVESAAPLAASGMGMRKHTTSGK